MNLTTAAGILDLEFIPNRPKDLWFLNWSRVSSDNTQHFRFVAVYLDGGRDLRLIDWLRPGWAHLVVDLTEIVETDLNESLCLRVRSAMLAKTWEMRIAKIS